MKILCLDVPGLHLGYLGCYGNEWVATPTLDRLAAEAVVFDQHYADNLGRSRSPWTGRYDLPLIDGPQPTGEAGEPPALSELLQVHGIGVALLGPAAAVSQGPEEGTALEWSLDGTVAALDRLSARENWLVWSELPSLAPPWDFPEKFLGRYFQEEDEEEDREPLTPFLGPVPVAVPPEDYRLLARLQNTYAGVVGYLDAALGLLLGELRKRRLLNELLLVLTSARGLALGEHGIVGEAHWWLHDELVHLPLVVRFPKAASAGRRVGALTQPVDLFPTLLQAFGLPLPATQGFPLQAFLTEEDQEVRQYACTGRQLGDATEWAMRTPEWAFLLPGAQRAGDPARAPQLYVKPDDRWEVNDVRHHHLELVEHLEETLRGFVAATAQPGPLNPPRLREVEGGSAEAGAN